MLYLSNTYNVNVNVTSRGKCLYSNTEVKNLETKTTAKQNCWNLEGINKNFQGLLPHREQSSCSSERYKDFLLIMGLKKLNFASVNYSHHLMFMLGRKQYSIMNQRMLLHFLISYSNSV